MKKTTLKERLQYQFDNVMSKGSAALVGLLFAATAAVAVVVGLLLLVIQHGANLAETVWLSIMHIIDAGTITGADLTSIPYLILMSIATICGIFVTSILIGIITTGFEAKLETLKKGSSKVIEKGHTVILGFNNNIYTIISELVQANESEKRGCIVVLAQEDKETMEHLISETVGDLKTTKVICRTGDIHDINMLQKCSIENSRSIIVNSDEDTLVVKSVLAVSYYLKEICKLHTLPHIVTSVNTATTYEALNVVAENNIEVVVVDDAVARIIAQTCRQPGLSLVLIELFDFDGDELYFEHFDEFNSKTFGDALNAFDKAIVFGYKRDEQVYLNPSPDTILSDTDEIILFMEDNGVCKPCFDTLNPDVSNLAMNTVLTPTQDNVLIIGANNLTTRIIKELDDFLSDGSKVTIATDGSDTHYIDLENNVLNSIILDYIEIDTLDRLELEKLLANDVDYILLLSSNEDEDEISDSKTLLRLIHLRDIAQTQEKHYSITSQLKKVKNQRLAQITQTDTFDLVIGSDIVNLILAQLSENRHLSQVFSEILDIDGSEISLVPASNYLKLNVEMNFYEVTQILSNRCEIAIGYKQKINEEFSVIINPLKSDKITFTDEDYIIVLS